MTKSGKKKKPGADKGSNQCLKLRVPKMPEVYC